MIEMQSFEALQQVNEILGEHPLIGCLCTGVDRSFKRSIYKVLNICRPSDLTELQFKIYVVNSSSKIRHLNRRDPLGTVLLEAVAYGGETIRPGDYQVFPKTKFLTEYRFASDQEIAEASGLL